MSYSKLLLITAAVFGIIGGAMGGHMAGAGSPALRPVHTHILSVGWLTLFAWAIYYKVYRPDKTWITRIHVWSAMIGSIGLTFGMYLYFLNPFQTPELFNLLFFIIGGTVLIVSYFLFLIMAVKSPNE